MRVTYKTVKEPEFNLWNINTIDFIESNEQDAYTFRYAPRAYDGRDYLTGAIISVNMDGIETWNQFQKEVLEDEQFITCFFKDFRMGYIAEKVYRRILTWASNWGFDDMPTKIQDQIEMDRFWAMMPESYMKLVISIVGKMPSYR